MKERLERKTISQLLELAEKSFIIAGVIGQDARKTLPPEAQKALAIQQFDIRRGWRAVLELQRRLK